VSVGIAFQRKLGAGLFGGEGFIMQQLIRVDTGCIVAFQPSVSYDIQYVGKIKSALFGGEGLFFATSILGGIDGLLDGDNS
jgi:uncharacterized protein (AIM24 family)